jgi:hypothetical protein
VMNNFSFYNIQNFVFCLFKFTFVTANIKYCNYFVMNSMLW